MSLVGRAYTCVLAPTAFTAAFDVFELTPADDKSLNIGAISIGQTSEVTDAQDEQLEIKIMRGGTAMTSGTGGTTAANGVSIDATGQGSGFTFEAGNTGLATFTGGVTLWEDTMNVRAGWQMWLPPEGFFGVAQGNGGMVVRMNSTPADSITFVASILVYENG